MVRGFRKLLAALAAILPMLGAAQGAFCAEGESVALESLLTPDGHVWQLGPEQFMNAHAGEGFRWLSVARRDAARAAHPALKFLGLRAWEAVARFGEGSLKDLTVSLYNRGDAGELDEEAFQKLLAAVDERLTGWAGGKGVALRSQERTNVAAVRRKAWVKEPYRVDLVWSFSEKSRRQGISEPRPEYARLEIVPFDPQQDPRKSALVGTGTSPRLVTALELRARVKRDLSGDVAVPSVPMVDQGQKGYCAAAVAERVLRYYGHNVDQHEIAQLANTSAAGGTTPKEMVAALRRIADEMRVDVTVLQDFDVREFEKTMTEYNRTAKKAHQPEIQFMHREGNMIILENPATVYREMDTALLREVRVKRDGAMDVFRSTVSHYINAGAPLVWGVIVGKVKETPDPHVSGGHMRLIIGYNDRTREILYSDTWGVGHELKRLSLADAWTITLGLYCLQPRDVHF